MQGGCFKATIDHIEGTGKRQMRVEIIYCHQNRTENKREK